MINRRTRAIRRLVALVGRERARDYIVTEPAIAGYCRVWTGHPDRDGSRVLWLRTRGRSAFAFAEPRVWSEAQQTMTGGDVAQLTAEFLRS